MPDPTKELPPPSEPVLLDRPSEERLLDEIELLRHQLEEERKRNAPRSSGRPKRKALWLIALGLAGILILGILIGVIPRYRRETKLKEQAQAEARELPAVNFISAQPPPAPRGSSCPATRRPLRKLRFWRGRTAIFASVMRILETGSSPAKSSRKLTRRISINRFTRRGHN